jgi:hypothetical protein
MSTSGALQALAGFYAEGREIFVSSVRTKRDYSVFLV